jgi:hypothetical protein
MPPYHPIGMEICPCHPIKVEYFRERRNELLTATMNYYIYDQMLE